MTVSCRVASRSQDGAYGSAAAMGVPSILIERGGRCGYTRQEQAAYLEDLRRILIAVGILDGEPLFNAAQKNITESAYYDAEATGCWHPYIQAVSGLLPECCSGGHRFLWRGIPAYYRSL